MCRERSHGGLVGAHSHHGLCKKSQGQPWPKSFQGLEQTLGLRGCGAGEGWPGGLQKETLPRQRTASGQLEPGEGMRCHSVCVMSLLSVAQGAPWPAGSRGRNGPRLLLTAEISLHFSHLRLPLLESPLHRSLLFCADSKPAAWFPSEK